MHNTRQEIDKLTKKQIVRKLKEYCKAYENEIELRQHQLRDANKEEAKDIKKIIRINKDAYLWAEEYIRDYDNNQFFFDKLNLPQLKTFLWFNQPKMLRGAKCKL